MKRVMMDCRTIVDVGYNVGEYSKEILSNDYAGKLIVVDALKVNIDITRNLFTPLNCAGSLITYLPFVLGDKEEIADFYINEDEELSGHNSFYDMKSIGYAESTNPVKLNIKRLDFLLSELDIRDVDFMKIDVEGYEMNVLKGDESYLKGGYIKILQLEYGHAARGGRILLKDLYDYLISFEYVGYVVMPDSLLKISYDPFMENKYTMINLCFIHKSVSDLTVRRLIG